jgi:hypothetical protein
MRTVIHYFGWAGVGKRYGSKRNNVSEWMSSRAQHGSFFFKTRSCKSVLFRAWATHTDKERIGCFVLDVMVHVLANPHMGIGCSPSQINLHHLFAQIAASDASRTLQQDRLFAFAHLLGTQYGLLQDRNGENLVYHMLFAASPATWANWTRFLPWVDATLTSDWYQPSHRTGYNIRQVGDKLPARLQALARFSPSTPPDMCSAASSSPGTPGIS